MIEPNASRRLSTGGLRARLLKLIALADEPTDDDDRRLRKRAGVFGGTPPSVPP